MKASPRCILIAGLFERDEDEKNLQEASESTLIQLDCIKKAWGDGLFLVGDGIRAVTQEEISDALKHSGHFTQIIYWGHGSIEEWGHEDIEGKIYFIDILDKPIETSLLLKKDKNALGIRYIFSCNSSVERYYLKEGEFTVSASGAKHSILSPMNAEEIGNFGIFCKTCGFLPNVFDTFEYYLLTSPETKVISGLLNGKEVFFKTSAEKQLIGSEEEIKRDRLFKLKAFRHEFRIKILGHNEKDFQPMETCLTPEVLTRYRELDMFVKLNRSDHYSEKRLLRDFTTYFKHEGNPNAILADGLSFLLTIDKKHYSWAVPLLIENGIDINHQQSGGISFLSYLCGQEPHYRSIKLLAGLKNIDVDIQGNDGSTPLHLACIYENESLVKLLLPKAKPNIQDKEGCAPLHWAVSDGTIDTLSTLLGMMDINVNIKDNKGSTPLHLAAEEENRKAVKLLDQYHAEVDIQDLERRTPLHLAVKHQKTPVAMYLLDEMDASPNIQDNEGRSPLHIACERGNPVMVKLLLKHGAKLETRAYDGAFTPLMLAAMHGHEDVVDALLEAITDRKLLKQKAVKSEKNLLRVAHEGKTAAEIADTYGYTSIAEKIEQRLNALKHSSRIQEILVKGKNSTRGSSGKAPGDDDDKYR